MGKGANKSSFGLSISDRKSSSNLEVSSAKANSIGNNDNLDRPFDCGGPTGSNSGGANEVVMVDHKSSPPYYYYLSADAKNSSIATSYYSQPFHVFSANPYNIPGEKMVPLFTNAQYTELERQAMIYKYMISSLPVPPHLLHALYVNNDNNVGNWRNGGCGVVEAGRCKRTDGKKWRCSRDVAPHQKYCERHLHRGRPRSRKPVENHKNTCSTIAVDENHKKPRLDQQNDDLPLNAINNRDVGFWAMNEGAFLGFTPNEGYNWEMQANNNGPMMGGWVDSSSHNEQVQNYVKMDHDYVYPEFCWGPLAEALFRNPPMTSTTL